MAKEKIKGVDFIESKDSVNGVKDDQFVALRDELVQDGVNPNLKYFKDLANKQLLDMEPYQYLRNNHVSERIIFQIQNTLYHKCCNHNRNAIENIITPNDNYPARSDFNDLSGKIFGRLKVIKWLGRDKIRRHHYYMCQCRCGNEKICAGNLLVNGTIRSCGCLIMEANVLHGEKNSRLYNKWTSMHQRCYDPHVDSYYLYGGKGIKICDAWRSGVGINGIHPFTAFRNWAYDNGYSDAFEEDMSLDVSIDRIDSNKDYCPENCRIANAFIQANNRSFNRLITYGEYSFPASIWARILDISPYTIYSRLKSGWNDYDIITTPVRCKDPSPKDIVIQIPEKYLCLNKLNFIYIEEDEIIDE